VDRAIEYFRCLREVLAAEDVRMSGAWSGKPQLRYASPAQLGSGEGPYIETVDWRWDGAFESVNPFVGIAVLAIDQRLYWVKSQPPVARAVVSFSAHGWAARPGCVSVAGAFHGAYLPSMPVEISDEPPASCVIGSSPTSTGMLHVVARLGRVAFAVVLLPGSAVRVGRNRLWHLREGIASQLPPELHRLTTRGRSGKVAFTS
jgi:hypothetical protein